MHEVRSGDRAVFAVPVAATSLDVACLVASENVHAVRSTPGRTGESTARKQDAAARLLRIAAPSFAQSKRSLRLSGAIRYNTGTCRREEPAVRVPTNAQRLSLAALRPRANDDDAGAAGGWARVAPAGRLQVVTAVGVLVVRVRITLQ